MKNYLLLFLLLFPAVSAAAVHVAGLKCKRYSKVFMAIACMIEFAAVTAIFPSLRGSDIQLYMPHVMGTGLYLKMDIFRYIFVWISCFIWLVAGVYSIWYFKYDNKATRFYVFFLITLSAVIGVFTSENLLNLFTFFEVMALTSYVMVIHNESKSAHEAGRLYLIVSIATGMITLMGIFILYEYTGELNISSLPHAVAQMGSIKYIAVLLMSSSFAAKACVFPLHIWLPNTYSQSPSPATAIFSAVLAKAGVFGIMIIGFMMSWDETFSGVLLALSLASMITGGALALVQVEVKKILAYSSMSQIGYMLLSVAATGLMHSHADAAISAGAYHVVNHALFKTLLFMSAGMMISGMDSDNLNSMGLRPRNKALRIFLLIGLLSNMGMPGFNGFTSKTLIHHAIANIEHIDGHGLKIIAESVFLISSALTAAYSAKLYFAVVSNIDKNDSTGRAGGGIAAYIPMSALVLAMAFISIRPQIVNQIMSQGAGFLFEEASSAAAMHFYTLDSIKSSGVILLLGTFIYRMYATKHISIKEDKSVYYPYIAQNWPSIERNLYLPVIACMFRISKSVFSFLDRFMSSFANRVCCEFKRICSFKIRSEKFKSGEGSYYSVSEMTRKMVFRMESVNYSVFVTASILVFLMFSLVKS